MKGFLTGLKMFLKYGAYITVLINVIGYSIEQIEKLENEKNDNSKI